MNLHGMSYVFPRAKGTANLVAIVFAGVTIGDMERDAEHKESECAELKAEVGRLKQQLQDLQDKERKEKDDKEGGLEMLDLECKVIIDVRSK